MKSITSINNEIGDAVFGVVSSESNRFDAFDDTTDEILLSSIQNGKLVAKEDFDEDEREAWNVIFDNYGPFLDNQSLYVGLSISDDRYGNRFYYLIW